jgi:hypothetical protein
LDYHSWLVCKIHPEHLDKNIPVHLKEDAVPYVPDWSMHRWVLTHTLSGLAAARWTSWSPLDYHSWLVCKQYNGVKMYTLSVKEVGFFTCAECRQRPNDGGRDRQ